VFTLQFYWLLRSIASKIIREDAGAARLDLTLSWSWSLYSLRKDWNQAKDTVAPWWGECSKEAFNTGLDQLARALKNWGDSRKGKRKGRPVGFPRFKSKRKARPSIRFTPGRTSASSRGGSTGASWTCRRSGRKS
jgi:putative transposase